MRDDDSCRATDRDADVAAARVAASGGSGVLDVGRRRTALWEVEARAVLPGQSPASLDPLPTAVRLESVLVLVEWIYFAAQRRAEGTGFGEGPLRQQGLHGIDGPLHADFQERTDLSAILEAHQDEYCLIEFLVRERGQRFAETPTSAPRMSSIVSSAS